MLQWAVSSCENKAPGCEDWMVAASGEAELASLWRTPKAFSISWASESACLACSWDAFSAVPSLSTLLCS